MSEENKNQDELQKKREARRKRRQRNQILAYSVVILVIALLAAGILGLIHYISEKPEKVQVSNPQPTQSEEVVEESSEPESESDDFFVDSSEPEETSEEPEESQEVIVELTYEQKLDEIVNAAIEVMPLEDKVAGIFIITPELLTGKKPVNRAGDSTKEALGKYAVGGLVYYSQNIKNEDAFKTMLENTVLYSRYPIFLAVEEEGGATTQIVKAKLGTKTDDAKTIAATGDPQKAYELGSTIGAYLKNLGLTVNFAPVADLACVDKSVMASRSFGNDVTEVFGYVTNEINGLKDQGIIACVKHFPGMGSVTTDTEKGSAISARSSEDFWANEMELFRRLVNSDVPMIMVSNMAAPSLMSEDEPNLPCSLSEKVVTDILRKQLGYNGLVITDCLNEKAISEYYSSEQAAIMALKAGCDMIVCPENFTEAYEGVLKAVKEGTISQERIDDALRRIYRIKYADRVE